MFAKMIEKLQEPKVSKERDRAEVILKGRSGSQFEFITESEFKELEEKGRRIRFGEEDATEFNEGLARVENGSLDFTGEV